MFALMIKRLHQFDLTDKVEFKMLNLALQPLFLGLNSAFYRLNKYKIHALKELASSFYIISSQPTYYLLIYITTRLCKRLTFKQNDIFVWLVAEISIPDLYTQLHVPLRDLPDNSAPYQTSTKLQRNDVYSTATDVFVLDNVFSVLVAFVLFFYFCIFEISWANQTVSTKLIFLSLFALSVFTAAPHVQTLCVM